MKNGSSQKQGKAWIPRSLGSLIEGTGVIHAMDNIFISILAKQLI